MICQSVPFSEIPALTRQFAALWHSCHTTLDLPVFSSMEQECRSVEFSAILPALSDFPAEMWAKEWPDAKDIEPFLPCLQSGMQILLDLHPDESRDIFGEDFKRATFDFIEQARSFDPNLGRDDIYQALRNVWIVNGLQRMMGEKVELLPASMAYSLLYPYTDNYVDDPDISVEEKGEFNHRLSLRLQGQRVIPNSALENRIYELISIIEKQYPRSTFPLVHKSIRDIHHAQIASVRLIGPQARLCYDDVLRISLEKGGTSVVADGALVNGDLTWEQIRFLYGYGAYLQFVDDLRDLQHDYQANQRTIFTLDDNPLRREQMVNHTFVFGANVMNRMAKTAGAFLPLMQKSINMLLIQSIGLMPEFFTSDFLQKMQSHSTCSFAFLREKKQEMLNYVKYSHPALRRVIQVQDQR